MEIEYQNTRKDYIDSFKLAIKNRAKKKLFYPFFIFIMAILFASSEKYGVIGYLLTLIGCFVFIALTGYFVPLAITIIKFNRLIAKENSIHILKKRLIISDEGISTQNEKDNLLFSWESISGVSSNEKFIYISLADKKSILLPKRHFSSQVDVANFIGLIQSNISKRKYGSAQASDGPKYAPGSDLWQPIIQTQKTNPPYLLGLLGVIPVVGVFIGIGLILYGLLKYKDKWLTLIGIGCILFTVAVYTSLSYYDGSKGQREKFVWAVQPELNGLVKEIEFYKTQKGAYPDSLKQLDSDTYSSTFDPLEIGKGIIIYNYHKIGNKYTLFSSGLDQIPNTADDIYPSIDTSKTGLIIKGK